MMMESKKLVPLIAVCCLLAAFAGSPAAVGQTVCDGFESGKKVRRLGGTNSFVRGGVASVEELQAAFVNNEDDLRYTLELKGMGPFADEIFKAIATGDVGETSLAPGTEFDWMVYRRGGEPRVADGLCMATRETYDAYTVEVELGDDRSITRRRFAIPKVCVNLAHVGSETIEKIPPPVCKLDVQHDCDAHTFTVNAAGSSPGVMVTMTGPGGTQTIIPAGSSNPVWSGPHNDPYRTDYTFTVKGENKDHMGNPQTCEETVRVSRCEAPPATCAITVSPSEARIGDDITVDVTGHWVDDQIEVGITDDKGNALSDPSLAAPFPNTISFRKPGTYSFSGTATNEAGETAACQASVEVDGRWVLRGFGGPASVDTDEAMTSDVRADGVSERTKYGIGSGILLGLGLERILNDRVGIEAVLTYGLFDSTFTLDLNDEWADDEDEISMLGLTIGPNFHLSPNSRADVYVGPFVGFGTFGDGNYSVLGESVTRSLDDDFIWGGQLGIDVPFSPDGPWAFHARALYMALSGSVDEVPGQEFDLDPAVFTVGLGYNF